MYKLYKAGFNAKIDLQRRQRLNTLRKLLCLLGSQTPIDSDFTQRMARKSIFKRTTVRITTADVYTPGIKF